MSIGVNKVIILGNLGTDPEMRATTTGSRVATVSIATSESWSDKTSGEKREKTEWHRVVFFNRLTEIVEQYLSKGTQVYIEGRLQTRKRQDQNGQDRYTTEIIAKELEMLGSNATKREEGSKPRNPFGDKPPIHEDPLKGIRSSVYLVKSVIT